MPIQTFEEKKQIILNEIKNQVFDGAAGADDAINQ